MQSHLSRQRGFSLIELITVIILLGIISVVAIGKLDTKGFDEKSFADELTSAIRYAQKVAVASNCASRVSINSNITLSMPDSSANCSTSATFSTNLLNPSTGKPYTIDKPSEVTLSSTANNITFLSDGSANNLIDITLSGNLSSHICVIQESGYTYQQAGAC